MRVVLTDESLRDLDTILAYTEANHPTALAAPKRHQRAIPLANVATQAPSLRVPAAPRGTTRTARGRD